MLLGNMQSTGPPPLTPDQGGYRPMYPPHLKQEHNRPIHQPVHDDRGQMGQMPGMNPMSSMHHNKHGGYHDPPPSSSQHQHPDYMGHSSMQANPSMHGGHMQHPSSSMWVFQFSWQLRQNLCSYFRIIFATTFKANYFPMLSLRDFSWDSYTHRHYPFWFRSTLSTWHDRPPTTTLKSPSTR